MILPCLCFTSISDSYPTVFQFTQSQSLLFFQCDFSLLAIQVPSLISLDFALPFPLSYVQLQNNVCYIKESSFSLWFSLILSTACRCCFPFLWISSNDLYPILPNSLFSSILDRCFFGLHDVCKDFCLLVAWTTIKIKLPLSKTHPHLPQDNNIPEIQ